MSKPIKEKDLYVYCPHCASNLVPQAIDNEKVKKCSNCGFIFWNNPKPVVSILLHKDGEILMLKRADEPFKNYWVLPGGFIYYRETAQNAIKRETKEETGLEIAVQGITGVYLIDDDPRGMHVDIIFYGTSKGKIRLSKEHKNWKYFIPDQLPEHIAYKHRYAINDWHKRENRA
ncbi:MAG: hypothetical protein A3B44_01495 [Candidatus Levybacteria bacterium RIFCSPLOWO2_01_FULL_38_21]|nr:MAG: hypothetical protein A3B44_01495 [Candidatus Levybacteria bacterium RIFCSPLOWO2_01_FULL_38_21]